MFGLPEITAWFVFGGFALAAAAALIFAITYKPESEDWWTFDDWFDGQRGPRA